jgi:hypothetical protein
MRCRPRRTIREPGIAGARTRSRLAIAHGRRRRNLPWQDKHSQWSIPADLLQNSSIE